MARFLTTEEDQAPNEDLTLEERVTCLGQRVTLLEARDGAGDTTTRGGYAL